MHKTTQLTCSLMSLKQKQTVSMNNEDKALETKEHLENSVKE